MRVRNGCRHPFLFFVRLALKYSKTNEAKPNNPIIEMIMIPNSELSMLTSERTVSGESKASVVRLNAALRRLYWRVEIYTKTIRVPASNTQR